MVCYCNLNINGQCSESFFHETKCFNMFMRFYLYLVSFFPEVHSDFFPSTLLVFLDGVVPGVLPVIGVSLRDLFPSTRLSEEKKETLENLK